MFVKFGCSNCFFLNTTNLICRSTDILECFRGSLRFWDNESRLYVVLTDSWVSLKVALVPLAMKDFSDTISRPFGPIRGQSISLLLYCSTSPSWQLSAAILRYLKLLNTYIESLYLWTHFSKNSVSYFIQLNQSKFYSCLLYPSTFVSDTIKQKIDYPTTNPVDWLYFPSTQWGGGKISSLNQSACVHVTPSSDNVKP